MIRGTFFFKLMLTFYCTLKFNCLFLNHLCFLILPFKLFSLHIFEACFKSYFVCLLLHVSPMASSPYNDIHATDTRFFNKRHTKETSLTLTYVSIRQLHHQRHDQAPTRTLAGATSEWPDRST